MPSLGGDDVPNRPELIARLAREIAKAPPDVDSAARLCHAICRVLGAEGASLTLDNATSNRLTLCATDHVAAHLDSAQEVLGEGPCIDAYITGVPVVADLESAVRRWPLFADRIRPTGIELLYALPMHAGPSVLGVVSLYKREASGLTADLADAAFLVEAIGAAVVSAAREHMVLNDLDAWPSRRDVHQATGMVIAQLAVTEADALAILRAHAYATGTDLPSVARTVIDRTLVFSTASGDIISSQSDRNEEGGVDV